MNTLHNIGVSALIGRGKDSYSDGVEVPGNARWLYVSGTPGIKLDGTIPETIEEQADQAWKNVLATLESAGMSVSKCKAAPPRCLSNESKACPARPRSPKMLRPVRFAGKRATARNATGKAPPAMRRSPSLGRARQ